MTFAVAILFLAPKAKAARNFDNCSGCDHINGGSKKGAKLFYLRRAGVDEGGMRHQKHDAMANWRSYTQI
jgi:hypothetical protein